MSLMVSEPQLFGGVHLSLLGLTGSICLLAVWFVRRSRTKIALAVMRAAGWTLLLLSLGQLVWWLLPGNWNIGHSLPLHYSDVLKFSTAVALIWHVRWTVAISYYWGLTLNLQALLTPHPSMFAALTVDSFFYWTLHILILAAPFMLVWGVGFRPLWRDYWLTYGLALGWAAMVMGINAVLGTNYGFLNQPPDGASAVDWLGSWPVYVIWMAVIAGVIWALMTWPWTRGRDGDVEDQARRS